ncbi:MULTISPECIES: CAP domain-containing protein [unclassified Bacillus (in: firmicutes)]|uniref:CAP domain-containing protein n=1 Tax=unclassified Bacillus (in: firmicutes) TaxID=185979 RepID=UPI0008F0C880|nr:MULTISPECIES: CAP domain-containing protein [unclassified Bacillus (in: firmicutes)]SFB20163.1 uncharacterized protein, YkwD family [Bacillus sp. UNCCL13]SFQ90826.1 uncharacterized protein, YkwD family [Bacillus sp. cl95]
MFKKKALMTVAAASALLMSGQLPNKAEASTTTPTTQQRVYVYQSSNFNMTEINKMVEDYFKRMGMTNTTTTVQQPTQTTTTAPAPAPAPVEQKPVATQPTATQTTSTISAYEQKVADLTNQERAKAGLKALQVDTNLSKMAHEKSRDMSVNNYFSHTSPTYGSPFDMMKQYGITYSYAGENIAMGQRTPEEVVKAWMNSEGHRKNILSPNFTHIGVGYVAEGNYWTQEFIGK